MGYREQRYKSRASTGRYEWNTFHCLCNKNCVFVFVTSVEPSTLLLSYLPSFIFMINAYECKCANGEWITLLQVDR